jgi:hypothetical protein
MGTVDPVGIWRLGKDKRWLAFIDVRHVRQT